VGESAPGTRKVYEQKSGRNRNGSLEGGGNFKMRVIKKILGEKVFKRTSKMSSYYTGRAGLKEMEKGREEEDAVGRIPRDLLK